MINKDRLDAFQAGGVTLLDPSTTFIDDGVTVAAERSSIPASPSRAARTSARTAASAPGAHHGLHDRRRRARQRFLHRHRVADRRQRHRRAVLALSSGLTREGRRSRRQFRGAQEDRAGRRLAGQSPGLSRRRDDRRRRDIGAGTITCNYDGATKHQTVIEAGAFIGSDTQLSRPSASARGRTSAPGRASRTTFLRVRWGCPCTAAEHLRWVTRRRRSQKPEARSKNKGSEEAACPRVFPRSRGRQKSHRPALQVYRSTAGFPRAEQFGLVLQMRRAAVSVPANIAEAFWRGDASGEGPPSEYCSRFPGRTPILPCVVQRPRIRHRAPVGGSRRGGWTDAGHLPSRVVSAD